jgi:hypothetical protein
MLISMIAVPVKAFVYNETATFDNNYEFFGPRIDWLQFKMYEGLDSMWIALQNGEIDITDWPLTSAWYTKFSDENPEVLLMAATGITEAGMYVMDFNYNPEPRMGNPPGSPPNRPNPVYDQVNHIPPISNNVFFRLGVGHLFDRAGMSAFLGTAGASILTPMPLYMGVLVAGYLWPYATGYAYDFAQAEGNFSLGHIYQNTTHITDGHWTRYWDYNNNGKEDAGEAAAAVIIQTWRADAYRKWCGEQLHTALVAMNFTCPIGVGDTNGGIRTGGANYQQVMLDKSYHITTLGWINMGPDPDYLYDLYNYDAGYWDDPESSCPNSAALNDPVLNNASYYIKTAPTPALAKEPCWSFQQRFEAICAQIPLFANTEVKASSKYYTGGNKGVINGDIEDIYRTYAPANDSRRYWEGFCDQMAYGTNSWFTMLNAYPDGYPYGTNGNMTLRYGWKEVGYPEHINPFYSEWYWDAVVLSAMYDTPGYRDPYDLSTWRGDLVRSWSVGTWNDSHTIPDTVKSKVTMTLRSDIKWSDGTPLTIADLIFSLVEAGPLMISKGFQPPWWWPTGSLVRSLSIIDAYTVEILWDVNSCFVESWTLGGFSIVPKHIWKPIIETGNPSQVTPDVNCIGSGPFRYVAWSPGNSLVMTANKPGSTVTTDRSGSVPITSPGYHAYLPVEDPITAKNSTGFVATKFVNGTAVTIDVTTTNLWWGGTLNVDVTKKITWPNATVTTDTYVESLAPHTSHTHSETFTWPRCMTTIEVWLNITSAGSWFHKAFYEKKMVWGSIREDIAGSNIYKDYNYYYPYTYVNPTPPPLTKAYNDSVPTPDCKVDAKDVSGAAAAFGAKPGDLKWWSVADIVRDYKINAKDIAAIASKFGWK